MKLKNVTERHVRAFDARQTKEKHSNEIGVVTHARIIDPAIEPNGKRCARFLPRETIEETLRFAAVPGSRVVAAKLTNKRH
jgi:hypothetical protein